jgi:hypothetical protein
MLGNLLVGVLSARKRGPFNTEEDIQSHGELEWLVGIVATSWRCVRKNVIDFLESSPRLDMGCTHG